MALMDFSFSKQQKIIAAAFFSSLITFLAYIPSLGNGFVNWDDPGYVYDNPAIRSIDAHFLKLIFTKPILSNWHPLTMLSYGLDFLFLGFNPLSFHLTNVILHASNVFLVFVLAVRLIERLTPGTGGRINALAAGLTTSLLFGLHPLHVESVSWVSERKDVLCAFFFLLSILAYLEYAGPLSGKKKLSYVGALFFFILSLLSKPMAVSLPFVLLILDFYPLGRFQGPGEGGAKRALLDKIPFFVLSAASAMLTVWAQRSGTAYNGFQFSLLPLRIVLASRAYAFYLYKMFLPLNLAPFYPYPRDLRIFSYEYLGAMAVFVSMTFFCVFRLKRHRAISAVWFYYLITLLPVIGIVTVGEQAAADRYTYLPCLGLFILAGAGAGYLFERTRAEAAVALILAVLVMSALTALTVRQEAIWKDSISLWTYAIEKFPGAVPTAYYDRGLAYQGRGDYPSAVKDYNAAIALNPGYIRYYINRGFSYREMGSFDLAVRDFNKAIELDPRYVKAYLNKGLAYLRRGEYEKAVNDFRTAVSLDPGNAFAYYNLGLANAGLKNRDEAALFFRKASDLGFKGDPGYRDYIGSKD